MAIVNDEFVVVNGIQDEKETSLPEGVYPDLVRGSYRFSMKRVNGTLQTTYGAWCQADAEKNILAMIQKLVLDLKTLTHSLFMDHI